MSLTATVLRAGLRRAEGRRRAPDVSIASMREGTERRARRLPTPRGVIVQRASLGGVPALRVAHWQSDADRAVLLLHGGAFVAGSARGAAALAGRLAKGARSVVYALEYRLAPEHPHPAGVDDAVAAVRAIDGRVSGGRIAVVGESAGGGLALAALHALRDDGGPMPRCAVLISPWVDLTLSGDSITDRAAAELSLSADDLAAAAEHYAPGALDQPGPSPLFADQSGLPPLLLQAGGDEILRSDAERLAARARADGADATLEVWDGMWHGWHVLAPFLPEARHAQAAASRFLRARV